MSLGGRIGEPRRVALSSLMTRPGRETSGKLERESYRLEKVHGSKPGKRTGPKIQNAFLPKSLCGSLLLKYANTARFFSSSEILTGWGLNERSIFRI